MYDASRRQIQRRGDLSCRHAISIRQGDCHKAFGLSVSDESVFFPGGNNFVPEENLRRIDLMPAERLIANNASTTGA